MVINQTRALGTEKRTEHTSQIFFFPSYFLLCRQSEATELKPEHARCIISVFNLAKHSQTSGGYVFRSQESSSGKGQAPT